jgi:hypothetical protein
MEDLLTMKPEDALKAVELRFLQYRGQYEARI